MNIIKNLLFLSLALSSFCAHSDGLLYRAYKSMAFGRQSTRPSNNQKTSWSKVAGSFTVTATILGIAGWLGLKKYSAHQAKQWRRIEIEDEQKLAQQDAKLLKKKQQALAIAKQEHAIINDMAQAVQTEIDALNIEIEQAAKVRYDLVQQKRAAYVTELAKNFIDSSYPNHVFSDEERQALQQYNERFYSDFISKGYSADSKNYSEAAKFSDRLAKDTELKTYDATILEPLREQQTRLTINLNDLNRRLPSLQAQ